LTHDLKVTDAKPSGIMLFPPLPAWTEQDLRAAGRLMARPAVPAPLARYRFWKTLGGSGTGEGSRRSDTAVFHSGHLPDEETARRQDSAGPHLSTLIPRQKETHLMKLWQNY